MNRYWLFYGANYYPLGGMQDCKGSFSKLEDCHEALLERESEWDWWHIFDTTENRLVAAGGKDI